MLHTVVEFGTYSKTCWDIHSLILHLYLLYSLCLKTSLTVTARLTIFTYFGAVLKPKILCNDHCVKTIGIRSFFGPYFPAFRLNMERYEVFLCIQSECGKMRRIKTPITSAGKYFMDTFHTEGILKLHSHKNYRINWRFCMASSSSCSVY